MNQTPEEIQKIKEIREIKKYRAVRSMKIALYLAVIATIIYFASQLMLPHPTSNPSTQNATSTLKIHPEK